MGNRSGRRSRRADRRRSRSSRSTGAPPRKRRAHARRGPHRTPTPLAPESAASVANPVSRRTTLTPPAMAALLGVAVAMAYSGLLRRFDAIELESIPSRVDVGAGALIALAIGVRLPHRLATWLYALTWRRLAGRSTAPGPTNPTVTRYATDSPLRWLVMSATALAAGIATALTPLVVTIVSESNAWMASHFFWLPVPMAILRLATALAAAALPFMLLGLAVACAHHLLCKLGQWDTKATAWVLLGTATGIALCHLPGIRTANANVLLAAAALPSLIAALGCAFLGTSLEQRTADAGVTLPPAWSDRWPTLLRGAIVMIAAGTALIACVAVTTMPRKDGGAFAALSLLALGGGMAFGSRAKRNGLRSIGGFGVACAGTGSLLAATSLTLGGHIGGPGPSAMLLVWLSIAAGGCAVAYGHQTLLHRVGNRSAVGGTTLMRMLIAAAVVVWLAAPLLCGVLNTPAIAALAALGFLAIGGLLIIHEPDYSPRTRRVRLCAVFGLIGAMITAVKLLPHPPVDTGSGQATGNSTHGSAHEATLADGTAGPLSRSR